MKLVVKSTCQRAMSRLIRSKKVSFLSGHRFTNMLVTLIWSKMCSLPVVIFLLLMVPQGKGGNKTSLTQVLVPVRLYLNKAQNVGKL